VQNAKSHFIEAKIYENIRISETTSNSVSASTWLCVISNMKRFSHETWQPSLYIWNLSKYPT